LLLIAILIRADSEGPVIFRQRRLGMRGRPFWVLKFQRSAEPLEVAAFRA
jgi:putative colanic acid biosynthesis UDP-glucose lipid carrier transferase